MRIHFPSVPTAERRLLRFDFIESMKEAIKPGFVKKVEGALPGKSSDRAEDTKKPETKQEQMQAESPQRKEMREASDALEAVVEKMLEDAGITNPEVLVNAPRQFSHMGVEASKWLIPFGEYLKAWMASRKDGINERRIKYTDIVVSDLFREWKKTRKEQAQQREQEEKQRALSDADRNMAGM